MGRIMARVDVENTSAGGKAKRGIDVLVDTGAAHLTLPLAWKWEFGVFHKEKRVVAKLADGNGAEGLLCWPADINIGGVAEANCEILFIDMKPNPKGDYDCLLGYIPLETAELSVDMAGHKLVPVGYCDLK